MIPMQGARSSIGLHTKEHTYEEHTLHQQRPTAWHFVKAAYWPYAKICQWISIMFATWPSMYDPVKSLLNAPDETEAEKLTERWMKAKLKELNYVGLTAALISGVVIGSFSTYSAPSDPWTTHALWLSALLLALTSISIATQQSIGLNRLSSNENGLYKIRRLLGEDNPRYHPYDRGLYVSDNEQSKEPRVRIRKSQLWIWQTPVMLLNFALLLYIIGLMTAVFSRAVAARGDWSDGNIKVGIFFGCAATFASGNYLISWICLNRGSLKY